MLETPIDFKEQMIETRRAQILRGAAEVFAEKGFHKATTKEIASAAGISEGTIYNYFSHKRELLLAMIELIAAQSLKSIIAESPPDDPRAFLSMILHDRSQLLEKQGYFLAPLLAEIFSDAELREAVYRQIALPITVHLERYLQAHLDSGEFRQIDPIIVTRALVGAMVVNLALKASGLEPRYQNISWETLIEQIVSLFLDGLWSGEGMTQASPSSGR